MRNGSISTGELVSFLLYLQSLSDAFSSIGYIFSSLTQAVGAADKVFELMYRKRRGRSQSSSLAFSGGLGEENLVEKVRTSGLEPNIFEGEISLQNVSLAYPSRQIGRAHV